MAGSRRSRGRWWGLLAALALLLQVDAVVKSTVMTALAPMAAAAMPDGPGVMDGMAMAHMPRASVAAKSPRPAPPGANTHCSYCAAAVHAPLAATQVALRPVGVVGFTAYRMASDHGPRGPPAVRPRARGPPILA